MNAMEIVEKNGTDKQTNYQKKSNFVDFVARELL